MSDMIKAVVFDVFGTLCRIGDKRRPFRQVAALSREPGRAMEIMARPVGLAGYAAEVAPDLDPAALVRLERDLHEELLSVELYPETSQVLRVLRNHGIKIGLASNLAQPYAIPVHHLLPFGLDAYAWSFDVGAIKPDPSVYQCVLDQLGCQPNQALMVGDTYAADYEGARSAGLRALHLDRNAVDCHAPVIATLRGVLDHLGLPAA